MFENRPEQERKKIFWLIILSITAVIFIAWLILFAKGFVLKSTKLTETNNQKTNQADFSEIKSELKSTINDLKELDLKQKFTDLKEGINGMENTQSQNENQNINISENINQPENSEPAQSNEVNEQNTKVDEQNNLENSNNSSIPRLPIEN